MIGKHRIGTYEINKVSLSCFDVKMYIQNNGYDGLGLSYQSWLDQTIILKTILKKAFCQAYYFNFQANQDNLLNLKKSKAFKKELYKELMEIVWHPKRCWNFYMS